MGWGPVSYTIPLPDSDEPTHYGLRADVDEQFIRWIRGLDPLPESCVELAAPVLPELIADFSPDPTVELGGEEDAPPVLWGRAHLDAAVAAHFSAS